EPRDGIAQQTAVPGHEPCLEARRRLDEEQAARVVAGRDGHKRRPVADARSGVSGEENPRGHHGRTERRFNPAPERPPPGPDRGRDKDEIPQSDPFRVAHRMKRTSCNTIGREGWSTSNACAAAPTCAASSTTRTSATAPTLTGFRRCGWPNATACGRAP